MDKLAYIIVGYVLLLIGGWRATKGKGERILFVAIMGYCIFLTVAHLNKWPPGSINAIHYMAFKPIGQALEHLLLGDDPRR